MYICENCKKEVFESFGSGRFCCRSCANTRRHSEETKDKISKTLIKNKSKKIKQPKIRKIIIEGQKFADELDLKNSPYSEYNTAFIRNQVDGRKAYELCLYNGNKLLNSEIVLVYRYIMSVKIGRKLSPNEVVHHKDGNKLNNDISNLEILTRSQHSSLHGKNNIAFSNYIKNNEPWNKGLKNCYTQESIEKMKISAINRHKNKK